MFDLQLNVLSLPTEPMNRIPRPRHELPDISAQQAAAAAGGVYVLGFIVANAHFANYQVTRLELLQTRYLGAGLLFLLTFSTPALLGAFARSTQSVEFVPLWKTRLVRRHIRRGLLRTYVQVFSTFALGLYFISGIAGVIIVGNVNTRWIVLSYSLQFFLGFEYKKFSTAARSLLAVVMMLTSAPFFGRYAYPSILPAFGGGAGWYARLGFSEAAEKRFVEAQDDSRTTFPLAMSERGEIKHLVVIIDKDNVSTTFLACTSTSQYLGVLVSVTVPSSSIEWQTTLEPVSRARAYEVLCKMRPPERRLRLHGINARIAFLWRRVKAQLGIEEWRTGF